MGSFTKKMKLIICLLIFASVYSSSDADVCDKNVCIKDLISNLRQSYSGSDNFDDQILALEDILWEYLPLIQDLNVKAFIDRLFRGGFGDRSKKLAIQSFLNPRQMRGVRALDERTWRRLVEPLDEDDDPTPGSLLQEIQLFEFTALEYLDYALKFADEGDLNLIKKTLRKFRDCNPALMIPLTGFISKNLDGLIETAEHMEASGGDFTEYNIMEYFETLREVPWFSQTEKTIESVFGPYELRRELNNILVENKDYIQQELTNFFKVFKTVNEIGTRKDTARLEVYLHYVTSKIVNEGALESQIHDFLRDDIIGNLELVIDNIEQLNPVKIKNTLRSDVIMSFLRQFKNGFMHAAEQIEELLPPPSCINEYDLPENTLFGEKLTHGHYYLLRVVVPMLGQQVYSFRYPYAYLGQ